MTESYSTCENHYNLSVRRSVFEEIEFENLSSTWWNIFKVHFLENDALNEKQILPHIFWLFSRVKCPRVEIGQIQVWLIMFLF